MKRAANALEHRDLIPDEKAEKAFDVPPFATQFGIGACP